MRLGSPRSVKQVFSLNKLVIKALKAKHPGARLVRTPHYVTQTRDFENTLLRSATIIKNENKPEEISKIQVEVNEKIYGNQDGEDDGSIVESDKDETTITISKKLESSQASSYEQQTIKGLEWGAGTNVGAQFGLQLGGLSGGVNAGFKKTKLNTTTKSTTKTDMVGEECHHTETVKIPLGCKAKVTMTTYRVKYQLEYSMVYKIPKTARIRVRYNLLCDLGWCSPFATLSAEDILKGMPDFRADEQYVYITQKGWLKWVADRMEVNKAVLQA